MKKKTLLFLFTWLMVGFASGTAVLVGPVDWITRYGRANGWSAGLEDNAVRAVIVAYVLASALAALWLTRLALRSPTRHVRIGVPVLSCVAALGCLVLWLSPSMMVGEMAEETEPGSSFTFGSYPTEGRMRQLKEEGYTAVVSLLHPAVVPFETRLIGEGQEAASEAGLEYIHIPMLPWVDDNAESVNRVEELAKAGEGRYYVHCYLGKDRVRLVRRIVQQAEPTARVEIGEELADVLELRRLSEVDSLERGEVVQVAEDVYLTPQLTDDEYMSYVLPGTHGPVVSLLDPENPDDVEWIERERNLLEANKLPFLLRPLPIGKQDPQRALEVAREVAFMPPPVVVHAFLPPSTGRSPAAEAFIQAFRSNLPPLPPSLFAEPMRRGEAEVVAPNVAVGPEPRSSEIHTYLPRRGVREVVYLGDGGSEDAQKEKATCEDAGLGWRAMEANAAELLETLASGGPWYVHGEGLETVRGRIAEELGPAIPESMRWDPAAELAAASGGDGTEAAFASGAGFLARMWPDLKTVLILGPIFLFLTAVAGSLVGWLRTVKEVRAPFTRKIFHFIIFSVAAIVHLAGGLSVVALFGGIVACAVLYAVYRGEGFPFYEAMARPSDAPRRSLFVIVPLATTALGGIAANFMFGAVAFVGYLVAGWGDAIGEPVGTAWGRHRYRVPSLAGVLATRSIEGSMAVVFMGALAAFTGLVLSGVAAPTALAVALACGVAGGIVEAFSNHGIDNLTVQVAASGTAFLLLL